MYHLKREMAAGALPPLQIACAAPNATGYALPLVEFIKVDDKRKCLKCASVSKKEISKTKNAQLVNRVSKQDGTIADTITFERALQSLKNTYRDMSFVESELLAGRKVQTNFMWYELTDTIFKKD